MTFFGPLKTRFLESGKKNEIFYLLPKKVVRILEPYDTSETLYFLDCTIVSQWNAHFCCSIFAQFSWQCTIDIHINFCYFSNPVILVDLFSYFPHEISRNAFLHSNFFEIVFHCTQICEVGYIILS